MLPRNWNPFPRSTGLDIAPRLTPALRSSLEKVLETQNGADLSLEESYALANSEGDDLLGLLVAANMLRAELAGNIVTYVVNRNINFTNICFVGCKFCAFSRGPRESDTYFLTLDEMARKGVEAWQLGATEVCIQGGLPRDLPKFYYRDILRAVKNAVPRMHIHAFSPMEIVYGVELTGMPLADYLSMLRDNGLGTLPGTAAEILDDEIRHILSANKLSTAQWVEVIRTAHRCGIRSDLDADVRTHGNSRALGAPDAPAARHSVRDRRLHRIRSARVRAPEHDALSSGTGAHRANAGRASQGSCAGARAARRIHQQYSGFVGKAESPALATLPACRRQRLRRHVDGREHFARSWSDRGPVHQPGRFSGADSGDGAHSRRAQHHVLAHPHQVPLDEGECVAEQALEAEFA